MTASILDQISTVFKYNNIKINETIDCAQIDIDQFITVMPKYETILSFIENIPKRDTFNISFIYSDDSEFVITSNKIPDEEYYQTFLEDISPYEEENEDTIDVKIIINKNIKDCCLSVYSTKAFCHCLFDCSLISMISKIAKLLDDSQVIFLEELSNDDNQTLITKSIQLAPKEIINEDLNSKYNNKRNEKINTIKENTYFQSKIGNNLLPEDFEIVYYSCKDDYVSKFKALQAIYSMAYISNSAVLDDNSIELCIKGQRSRNYIYPLGIETFENSQALFNIYQWIYSSENASDKVEIARNIISLHCKFNDLNKTDEKSLDSMRSNYAVYLKSSVFKYIDLKEDIANLIISITKKSEDALSELSSNIKRSFFAIFTFLITIFLTHIQTSVHIVFNANIKILTLSVLIGCLLHTVIGEIEFNKSIKRIEISIDRLKINYEEIFDKDDIEECLKKIDFANSIKAYRNHASVILYISLFLYTLFTAVILLMLV